MNLLKLAHLKSGDNNSHWLLVQVVLSTMVFALLGGLAIAEDVEDEQPFGATSLIIELTDNDIELQVFVDGVEWNSLQIYAPNERSIFTLRAQTSRDP